MPDAANLCPFFGIASFVFITTQRAFSPLHRLKPITVDTEHMVAQEIDIFLMLYWNCDAGSVLALS
ncbi:hypothetical protein DI43_16835 [Geobacillus sp. CAMR12739]|nr:hypothetical protein DI43_16835 [Geobacillus sp. CAMR12739]